MGRKYNIHSKEEKLNIVRRHLDGEAGLALERETGISHEQIRRWTSKYMEDGEIGLEQNKKPGNPLSKYERRKELTYEEKLLYQIELLKRELLKKEAEVTRLKKLNARKVGDTLRK